MFVVEVDMNDISIIINQCGPIISFDYIYTILPFYIV